MFATRGEIGPYTIDPTGLNATTNVTIPGGTRQMYADYGISGFDISSTEGTTVDSYTLRPYTGFTITRRVNNVQTAYTDIAPSGLTTTGGVHAQGDIGRWNSSTSEYENVITSYDGNILRVRKMTASAYESLSTKDAYTLYIIKD